MRKRKQKLEGREERKKEACQSQMIIVKKVIFTDELLKNDCRIAKITPVLNGTSRMTTSIYTYLHIQGCVC